MERKDHDANAFDVRSRWDGDAVIVDWVRTRDEKVVGSLFFASEEEWEEFADYIWDVQISPIGVG